MNIKRGLERALCLFFQRPRLSYATEASLGVFLALGGQSLSVGTQARKVGAFRPKRPGPSRMYQPRCARLTILADLIAIDHTEDDGHRH